MHKIIKQSIVLFIVVTLMTSALGMAAYAQGSYTKDSYDRSERSGEKMTADIVFLRPAGLLATALGAAVFLISSPFSVLGGNSEEAYEELVKKPARYTFERPLGDF